MENGELRYVLDDVLDMKYRCNAFERSFIIEEIVSRTVEGEHRTVQLLDAILVDGTLSVFSRSRKQVVKECISWCLSKERPLASPSPVLLAHL